MDFRALRGRRVSRGATKSSFMTLPAEIREMIYGYTVTRRSRLIIKKGTRKKGEVAPITYSFSGNGSEALTMTSATIRAETLQYLWKNAVVL